MNLSGVKAYSYSCLIKQINYSNLFVLLSKLHLLWQVVNFGGISLVVFLCCQTGSLCVCTIVRPNNGAIGRKGQHSHWLAAWPGHFLAVGKWLGETRGGVMQVLGRGERVFQFFSHVRDHKVLCVYVRWEGGCTRGQLPFKENGNRVKETEAGDRKLEEEATPIVPVFLWQPPVRRGS